MYNVKVELKINGSWIDKTEYLQLPISINETMDETLDTGEIVLNFTNDSEEYEAFTPVKVTVYDGAVSKLHYMKIQRDNLEEIHAGMTSHYKHRIVLIEATESLKNEVVTDFSITQPIEAYSADLSGANLIKDYWVESTSNFWNNRPGSGLPDQNKWRNSGVGITYSHYYEDFIKRIGTHVGAYKFNINLPTKGMKRTYSTKELIIDVPSLPSGSFVVAASGTWNSLGIWWYNYPSTVFTYLKYYGEKKLSLEFTRELWDTTTNTNVSYLLTNDKINISELTLGHDYRIVVKNTNPNGKFWNTASNQSVLNQYLLNDGTSESTPQKRTVRQVLEADDYVLDGSETVYQYHYDFSVEAELPETLISVADAITKAIRNISVKRLRDARYYRDKLPSDHIVNTIERETTDSTTFNNGAKDFFGDVSQYAVGTYLIMRGYLQVGEPYEYDYIYVASEVVDNIINTSEYEAVSAAYYTDKSNYSVDPIILDRTANIVSPDYTFAGLRNLFEILAEIGKVFYSIPRVKLNSNDEEYITFDILEELVDNPNFEPLDTPYRKSSSTDNFATGLIANVENMIIDSNNEEQLRSVPSVYYPSKSTWMIARTSDFNAAHMDLDDMAIVIDDPNQGIYNLRKVLVSNIPGHSGEVDITNFIYEETEYNSLPATFASKGHALYYKRGENIIYGLGALPEKDRVLFNKNGEYKIAIILKALGINVSPSWLNIALDAITAQAKNEILNLKYRVEYIPIVKNMKLTFEQSKVSSEKGINYSNYSQPERRVSGTQLAKNADNILRRTGVNNIEKEFILEDLLQIPFIGEILDDNGYRYYADKIVTVYDNNTIKVSAVFSRNRNKISPYAGWGKNYRESRMAQDDIIWKSHNINDYCMIDTIAYDDNELNTEKLYFMNSIRDAFNPQTISKVDTVYISNHSLLGDTLSYTQVKEDANGDVVTDINGVAIFETVKVPYGVLPIVGDNSGYSLKYSFSAKDSYALGRVSKNHTSIANRLQQSDVRYVDDDGRCPVMDIRFLKNSSLLSYGGTANLSGALQGFQARMLVYSFIPTIPVMKEKIFIDKDNRESIQIVYQIHVQSRNKDIDVKPALISYNKTIYDGDPVSNLVAVGITNMESFRDKSLYDYNVTDVINSSPNTTIINDNTTIRISSFTVSNGGTYEGYAWVYPDSKEIAIIHKFAIEPNTVVPNLYMNFSHKQRS